MEDKPLSEKESLALIGQVIGEAKNFFYETGVSSLILGFCALACMLLAYGIAKGMNFPFNPFYLMFPAVVVQGYMAMKEERRKPVKTFTDRAIDMVWTGYFLSVLAFTICAGIVGLGNIMFTVLLFLTAFAAFVTGAVTKFSFMIIASLLVMAMGGASLFIAGPAIYLLCAATAVLIWIIPGFMMRNYFKKLHPNV